GNGRPRVPGSGRSRAAAAADRPRVGRSRRQARARSGAGLGNHAPGCWGAPASRRMDRARGPRVPVPLWLVPPARAPLADGGGPGRTDHERSGSSPVALRTVGEALESCLQRALPRDPLPADAYARRTYGRPSLRFPRLRAPPRPRDLTPGPRRLWL